MNTRLATTLLMAVVAGASASAVDSMGVRIIMASVVAIAAVVAATRATRGAAESAETRAPAPAASVPDLRAIGRDRRRPIVDRASGLCVDWYFRLRLEEEIARASRFGQPFAVALIAGRPDLSELASSLGRSLRSVDYAADLGGVVAVVLPNTSPEGAETFRERLASRFEGAEIQIAEYPRDGLTVSRLLGIEEWSTAHREEAA
jgi:GGDEF domain-containing protein